MIARRAFLALLAGGVAGGACAQGTQDPRDNPFDRRQGWVQVMVRNQHEMAVILHAYGPVTRQRLGEVDPGRVETFLVPWTRAEELRIRVEAPTGPHMESNRLLVRPGDRVVFTVASEIGRSVLIYR